MKERTSPGYSTLSFAQFKAASEDTELRKERTSPGYSTLSFAQFKAAS